jgi:DNA-binding transcriptional MerR regulator
MGAGGVRPEDALPVLREYRQLSPWNLRDLATLAGAILDASGVRPINAAASARPNERTIRFYVTRGLVTPPEGRGTAAIYAYRHLLQVLWIKLRQMEGATLAAIAADLEQTTGDILERRVAGALGPSLPAPDRLPLGGEEGVPRGRAGRLYRSWSPVDAAPADPDGPPDPARRPTTWCRLPVAPGIELHLHADHPLARARERSTELADAVRLALSRVLARGRSMPDKPAAAERPDPVRSRP